MGPPLLDHRWYSAVFDHSSTQQLDRERQVRIKDQQAAWQCQECNIVFSTSCSSCARSSGLTICGHGWNSNEQDCGLTVAAVGMQHWHRGHCHTSHSSYHAASRHKGISVVGCLLPTTHRCALPLTMTCCCCVLLSLAAACYCLSQTWLPASETLHCYTMSNLL